MMIWKDGRFRLKARRVISITLVWTLIGALDALNTLALSDSEVLKPALGVQLSHYFWVNTLIAGASGIVSGSLLVFFLREWLRSLSFGLSLLLSGLIITLLNFNISVVVYDLFLSPGNESYLFQGDVLQGTAGLMRRSLYIKNLAFWTLVVLLTLVMLNVNDKYGPGVLTKLLMGRYHRPREEERIFMFVDIRSSTTIAERLGHIRFFNLLNDFFRDITNPIIFSSGEIYQYVGDEVVISWTMERGLANANCVRCFFHLQETIQKFAGRYREKYGLVPEFKAGLHCGPVTIGEIGVLKKDIVFSGDVMNTTSRIQDVCNKFRVSILLSKDLLDRLHLPPHSYHPKRVGIIELKGKRQKVELYTFEESPGPGTPAAISLAGEE